MRAVRPQAPELLLSPRSYDGKAADVWACGVLLFTLLTGGAPSGPSWCRAGVLAWLWEAQMPAPSAQGCTGRR